VFGIELAGPGRRNGYRTHRTLVQHQPESRSAIKLGDFAYPQRGTR
jgi:hypothetical protein